MQALPSARAQHPSIFTLKACAWRTGTSFSNVDYYFSDQIGTSAVEHQSFRRGVLRFG